MARPETTHETDARRYTTAISKGAGMLEETRTLLRHWQPDESLVDFTRRVQAEDILGSSTAYRMRDVVRRVFAPRFLTPDDQPARVLKCVLEADLPYRAFTEMLLAFTARFDPLVHDFTTEVFWQAAHHGRIVIDTDTAVGFLSEAMADGRISPPWSDSVSVRIARCLLGLLRDVGLLRETHRGRREIVAYRMSDAGVALLARYLHEQGGSDAAVCEHVDWALFGMSRGDVIARVGELGDAGGLIVQSAGSVIRITWTVESIEELIDVIARHNI